MDRINYSWCCILFYPNMFQGQWHDKWGGSLYTVQQITLFVTLELIP